MLGEAWSVIDLVRTVGFAFKFRILLLGVREGHGFVVVCWVFNS